MKSLQSNPFQRSGPGGGAKAPLSNKQHIHHIKGPAAAPHVSNAGKIGKKR